jgi:hypothetical protein
MGFSSNPAFIGGQGGGGVCVLAIPTAAYKGSAPGASVTTAPGGITILTYTNPGTYTT